jgi:hypothetical protein
MLSAVRDFPAGVESEETAKSGVLGEGMRTGPTAGESPAAEFRPVEVVLVAEAETRKYLPK